MRRPCIPTQPGSIDQILFSEPTLPARLLAALDAVCFGSEAMTCKEWLKVTSANPIIVCAWQNNDKDHPTGMSVARYAAGIGYLYSTAVVPEARRMGIGAAMLNWRLDLLREKGCRIVQAHTRTENVASQELLKKGGFSAIQYIPDFYDEMEDAILWQRVF